MRLPWGENVVQRVQSKHITRNSNSIHFESLVLSLIREQIEETPTKFAKEKKREVQKKVGSIDVVLYLVCKICFKCGTWNISFCSSSNPSNFRITMTSSHAPSQKHTYVDREILRIHQYTCNAVTAN